MAAAAPNAPMPEGTRVSHLTAWRHRKGIWGQFLFPFPHTLQKHVQVLNMGMIMVRFPSTFSKVCYYINFTFHLRLTYHKVLLQPWIHIIHIQYLFVKQVNEPVNK